MERSVEHSLPGRVVVGDIELDLAMRSVKRSGRQIRIGPTEFRLLAALMEQPGRVVTRAELLRAVWGREAEIDPRTVDAHVSRLRRAMVRGKEINPIETFRGVGYLFCRAEDR